MKTKAYDCINMKREAQRRIRAALLGKSRQEEIDYFREGADEFEQRVQSAKDALTKGRKADVD